MIGLRRSVLPVVWLWLASAAAAQTPAAPKPGAPDPLVLEVGLHLFQGDRPAAGASTIGTHTARAGEQSFTGYIWTNASLCFYISSDKPPAATTVATPTRGSSTDMPSVGWRVSGKVLDRTGDDFRVQIEWQRLWDRSLPIADGPKGSKILTIRPGERIGLDGIGPEAASPCRMTGARLEAAIVTETDARRAGGFNHGDAGDGQVAIRFVTRSGTNPSSLPGAGPVLGPAVPDAAYQAELWLVHTLPNAKEESLQRSISLGSDATRFAFPPVAIATRAGQVDVTVSGLMQPVALDGGAIGMRLMIERRLGGALTLMGSSGKTLPLPDPADVISIEMPAVYNSPQDLLAGHDFSLRLRVVPRGK